MTKAELINDVVYEMSGYLTSEGIDRLKTVITFKLVNINLTATETLPSTNVYDNEWIMERYIIDLTATGRKRSTIQKYMSSFFAWAYRKKHIEDDVSRDIDKIRQPQKRKERLSDEEIARASLSIGHDLRLNALFELMLSAGPRVGEIVNLDIDNLDFAHKEIHIWGEKTSQWRTCFMTERCKQALKQYIGDRTEGAVFIGLRGRGRMCNKSIEDMVKEIALFGGCKFNATVHSFRKTFASREYRRTKDVLFVSKRLGHSSTDVTIKYYICDDVELDRMQANLAA